MKWADRFNDLLDRIGAGEGLWILSMTSLLTLGVLLCGHKLAGVEFVSAFSVWCGAVFGSAAIAGFRDMGKQSTTTVNSTVASVSTTVNNPAETPKP